MSIHADNLGSFPPPTRKLLAVSTRNSGQIQPMPKHTTQETADHMLLFSGLPVPRQRGHWADGCRTKIRPLPLHANSGFGQVESLGQRDPRLTRYQAL